MYSLHARSTRLVTLTSLTALGAAWLAACGSGKDPGDSPTTTAQTGSTTTATGSGGATVSSATSSGAGGSGGADLAILGEACSKDIACGSGHCTDGVCCDTAATDCNGCKACNLDGSKGTCGNEANGTTCGMDQVCGTGSCVACKEGEACTTNPGAPCKTGVIACGSGMPVCIDGGNVPAATACGAQMLQVCDGKGACNLASCTGKLQFKKDDYTTGAIARKVLAGDLNADAQLDLVVVNSTNSLNIFTNKGNGSFGPKSNMDIGFTFGDAFLADFNNDGKLEVAPWNANQISILGVLVAEPCVNHSAADINGDGRLDFVCLSPAFPPLSQTIKIRLQKADGTFQVAASPYLLNQSFNRLYVEDLNGDALADILRVAGCQNKEGYCGYVAIGLGDGKFKAEFPIDALNLSLGDRRLALADFNSDGTPDLASHFDGVVSVQIGKGDGSFLPKTDYEGVGLDTVNSIFASDLNGDGKSDIVNVGGSELVYLMNKGNGIFAPKVALSTSVGTVWPAGDLNGDGRPDLVDLNADTNMTVLLSNGCTP